MHYHNKLAQRPNMRERHQEIGFVFSDIGGVYWDETRAIEFTSDEIDTLEQATQDCHEMAMAATKAVIELGTRQAFIDLGIPDNMIELVKQSWANKEPALYGRFDFALTLDAKGTLIPKCYEYNADTPTSLFESSIVQWQWLQDLGMPDQFNFIHEQLIEHWESIKAHYGADKTYYFTGMPTREDWSTVVYLQETATEAGLIASAMDITDVALADTDWSFLDARNKNDIKPIDVMFKLYPWEYFAQDNFFKGVAVSQTKWLEPAWKLVTSSKGLLAKMYEMFPDSPWLIPTRLATAAEKSTLEGLQDVVIKPCLSREGSGVIIVKGKEVIRSTNDNANNSAASVVQHLCPTLQTADGSIIAGVWVIGGVTCGMGLRLDGDITGDLARFIPHFFI